MNWNLN